MRCTSNKADPTDGTMALNSKSPATTAGSPLPGIEQLFAGAMPKQEVGATSFLKATPDLDCPLSLILLLFSIDTLALASCF